jgi:hypothetical protein
MSNHTWNFFRIGGFDQVALTSAADLENLHTLDPKLWVALSCPVKGLELDEKTLALIDTDGDGRIRVPELLAAIAWARPYFKDLGVLLTGRDTLNLDAFAPTPEGQSASASAQRILASLGKSTATAISLAEASDTNKLYAAARLNGDGIITPATPEDPAFAAVLVDILATLGGTPDRSGLPGIDLARTDTFFAAVTAHLEWADQATSPAILTLGAATSTAASAVATVRAKVDDYFARARLAAFDPRALAAVNRSESDYLAVAAHDLTTAASEVAHLPVARINPGQPLTLLEAVNPAWIDALAALHREAVTPAFGSAATSLTEAQWTLLKSKTDAHSSHVAAKRGAVVAKLGLERLRILDADAPATRAALGELIARDAALSAEFETIANVEKLLRFTRDFRSLLHNYVNFFDFYSPDRLAVFQAGTLYLDNRSTEFCLEVAGPSPLAAMSKAYIAYCDLKRPGGATRKIAACITQGDSDYLFVGRNGLFYDRQGLDWDASITAIVDNPISVQQAFLSPYKKFLRMIEEQVAKRAAAAETESNARLAALADKTAHADKLVPAPSPPAAPKKIDVGAVAAIGVAITGAISALTLILGYVFGLAAWQYPLVLLGVVLVISGPSMLIAWLKLRQRTLAPLLEANGWAINGRVGINIPFGTKLTERAVLPPGSKLDLNDPYRDRAAARRARITVFGSLFLLLAIAFAAAWFTKVWPFAS